MRLVDRRDFLKRVSEGAEMKRSHKRFWLEHCHAAVARLDEALVTLAVLKGIVAVPPGNRARIGGALNVLEAFPKVRPLGLHLLTLAAVSVLHVRGSRLRGSSSSLIVVLEIEVRGSRLLGSSSSLIVVLEIEVRGSRLLGSSGSLIVVLEIEVRGSRLLRVIAGRGSVPGVQV
jgi:hypothetical protein